ncbi:MAG: T9SS type A sorting domain-containing protein [Bacteroidetes bacterium]|nr:MAG: T9SS type A sorting domain-containing protein [Bacteroidota bacterium]
MNRILLTILSVIMFGTAAIAGNAPAGPGDKNPVIKSYPNPVSSELTVEVQLVANNFSKVEVKIVNLLGQDIVPAVKADLEGLNNTFKVDVREVPAGIYFMEVTTTATDGSSFTHTKKITKH